VGHLEIRIPLGGPREYGLDLGAAEARVTLDKGLLRAFASAALPVVLLRLEGVPAQENWTADKLFGIPNLTQLGFHIAEWKTVTYPDLPNDAAGVMRIEGPGGVTFAIAAGRHVEDAYTDMAISVATLAEDSDPMERAVDRVTRALTAGYAQRLAEHVQALRLRSGPSTVSIGDAALQTQYDVSRHLLVSGSQRSSPPLASHGVWTPDSEASSWYGLYDNVTTMQTTYGSYAAAGLFDCGLSLFDMEWRLLPRMRELARDVYGVDGAILPGYMGLNGAPISFHPQCALSPTNGAWMADLFARHWRVTQDLSFLRGRAYPWCSAIGEALAGLLLPDEQHKLHLPLSTTPAVFSDALAGWLTPNSNYDLAAMRALFSDLTSMARALREDKDAQRWSQVLSALDDFALDARGGLALAPGEAFTESGPYLAHAVPIFPLGQISIDGGERERAIVDATLDTILDAGTSRWIGSTYAWFACLAARAGRPETALAFLRDHERAFTLRNGFGTVGDQSGEGLSTNTGRGFAIEGNMLAMEAVHEMLLQSWGGVVRVFPAASVTWPSASFEQLRAEGGFVVSARRKDGATSDVRVRASVPATLRLRDPFGGGACTWSRPDVARDGADWTVSLGAGEELVGTRDRTR
jgi:alpha-L-fucosidase 2